MKSNKKKKTKIKVKEVNIITFLNERIKRINKALEKNQKKFQESKNNLFSDKQFFKNISKHSKLISIIKS